MENHLYNVSDYCRPLLYQRFLALSNDDFLSKEILLNERKAIHIHSFEIFRRIFIMISGKKEFHSIVFFSLNSSFFSSMYHIQYSIHCNTFLLPYASIDVHKTTREHDRTTVDDTRDIFMIRWRTFQMVWVYFIVAKNWSWQTASQ